MTTMTIEAADAVFAQIDETIASIKLKPIDPMTIVQTPAGRLRQALSMFRVVRPILAALTTVPLIPNPWRSAIQLFIVALDGLNAEVSSADFKAGKDL
jgi:hypothetical protein